jgi:adenylate cyclase
MGKEIERKFLVKDDSWRRKATGTHYRQGYLASQPERSVRVRIAGAQGLLTIKGPSVGAGRDEFEYKIPLADATYLLNHLCEQPLIEKTRYEVPFNGHTWEVDVFDGENRGLVLAEIELSKEDEQFMLPPWIGGEVTHDSRYFNASLTKKPFSSW